MLDDRRDLAIGTANDASVTGRIVELDGQQRKDAFLRALGDLAQRLGARQRIGAEQHQRDAVGAQSRHRAPERIAGAARRILARPGEVGVGKSLAHLAARVDDADGSRLELARCREHVREQRPAAERLQHLGQRRAHALALSGSENGDLQRRLHQA